LSARTLQPAGNTYDKYRTTNPVARYLMKGFLDAFDELSGRVPVSSALEIGCGEGELSICLARRGFTMRGCDISADIVEEARTRAAAARVDATFWAQSIESIDVRAEAAPLVICCEVLEHLDDPLEGLRTLAALTEKFLLVSVPREPIWRALNMARGQYLPDFGNTPGHVNHWSQRSFRSFIQTHFDIVDHRAPLPWTMFLCTSRRS